MVVRANISAINTNRQLGLVNASLGKSTEKLSSGYRINRSADDAAGLAISEKMRRQIRGLTQATYNAQDGVSFCQIADGALNEVHAILKRCEELTIQAANGTNTQTDRAYIQAELDQLSSEIDRVHTTSTFNERNVFTDGGLTPSMASISPSDSPQTDIANYIVEWSLVDKDGNLATPQEIKATGIVGNYAGSDFAQFIIEAASNAVGKIQNAYPQLMSAASSPGIKIGLNIDTIDGVGGVLATARLELGSSESSTVMSYTLNIDTSDYNPSTFGSMTDAKKADLAATVAHEMTHLVMYDTLSNNMLGDFPGWFVEGMAQTSSGDNGWVTLRNPASINDAISTQSFMYNIYANPYGVGYVATMALGHIVSNQATVSSDSIKSGLDTLLSTMAKEKLTFDQAINKLTPYSSESDYYNKYQHADSTLLQITREILLARGTNGAGSLLAPSLSTTEADAFVPSSLNPTGTNYTVDDSNTKFSAAFGTGYTFPQPGSSSGSDTGFFLHVGSESDQTIRVKQFNMSASSIFDRRKLDVTTSEKTAITLSAIKVADENVSAVRSYYGSMQNRLEHTINNLNNVVENTTSAESLIRDTDMANEMVKFSKNQILSQAGMAMLAQTNQHNQGVLQLLS